jgi:DNA-directed RNA polymerase II subunit RPB11
MNAPERHKKYQLDDDEKRMTYKNDEKIPNAGTFTINKEDHTVGNLLRMQILRSPDTKFAGYQLPHPLMNECRVKIQTTSAKLTPIGAFQRAIEDLQSEMDILDRNFREQVAKKKAESG